jgi:ATP-dependent protease ClpP protease subunit
LEHAELANKLIFTNRVINGVAYMLLNKHIGPNSDDKTAPFIDGPSFADEMYWLKSQGIHITVKINSPGGRVDHGWSIIDAIKETEADTHLVGLGASMAGIAFLFGKNRYAEEHSALMLHGPHGKGSSTYLNILRETFTNLIHSFSKMPKEKAEQVISKGDHFFDISDMESYGFVESVNIKRNNKKFIKPNTTSVTALYEAYASVIDESKQEKDMNIFAKWFGKETEQEALVAAVEMKTENEALKNKLTAQEAETASLKAKVQELENASKQAEAKAKAKELIESAIKAGKLSCKDETEKNKAIEGATANYDFTKQLFDSMPAKKTTVAAEVVNHEAKGETKTYEYLAVHDPKELERIAKEEPEAFDKLADDYNKRNASK